MRRTVTALAATTLLATLALTGCSDDNNTPTPPAAPAAGDPRAALEQTARDYVTALYTPDADKAWAIVSQRCREQLGRQALDEDVRRRQQLVGRLELRSVTVDEVSGDRGRVSYDVGVPTLNKAGTRWVLAGGAWRWDDC